MKRIALIMGFVAAMAMPVAVAAPASAAWGDDCPYPYVCLYTDPGTTKIAQYKDYGYQNLQTSDQNIADAVKNTRKDDSVWLMDTGRSPDRYICIPANSRLILGDVNISGTDGNSWANDVDTIVIWNDNGKCGQQQGTVPDGWRP